MDIGRISMYTCVVAMYVRDPREVKILSCLFVVPPWFGLVFILPSGRAGQGRLTMGCE